MIPCPLTHERLRERGFTTRDGADTWVREEDGVRLLLDLTGDEPTVTSYESKNGVESKWIVNLDDFLRLLRPNVLVA